AVRLGTSRGSADPSRRARKGAVIWMIGSGPNAEEDASGPGMTRGCADAAAVIDAAIATARQIFMTIPQSARAMLTSGNGTAKEGGAANEHDAGRCHQCEFRAGPSWSVAQGKMAKARAGK